MPDNQTNMSRTITNILFVDHDGQKKVATATDTAFDTDGNATISLVREPDGYKVYTRVLSSEQSDANAAALALRESEQAAITEELRLLRDAHTDLETRYAATFVAPPTPSKVPEVLAANNLLTIEHLQLILADLVPRISQGFTTLGLPSPKSRDAVDHNAVLTFLRTAVAKAITTTAVQEVPVVVVATSPPIEALATVTPIKTPSDSSSGIGTLLDRGPIVQLDGMDRDELLTGNKKALKALFVVLHARGATAVPDFEPWARAENIWPADGRFTAEVRASVSAAMLRLIEYPVKIATGLHESMPGPIDKAA